jgi:hypothetical protein
MRSWLEPSSFKTTLSLAQQALVQKAGRVLVAGRAEDASRLIDEVLKSILESDDDNNRTVDPGIFHIFSNQMDLF